MNMKTLTEELLLHAKPCYNDDKTVRQIALLDKAIECETDIEKKNYLCAQFQALMWARSPVSFAPPISI